ncbi:MAG: hypothetical protein ACTTJ6_03085 [Treponema sp.]
MKKTVSKLKIICLTILLLISFVLLVFLFHALLVNAVEKQKNLDELNNNDNEKVSFEKQLGELNLEIVKYVEEHKLVQKRAELDKEKEKLEKENGELAKIGEELNKRLNNIEGEKVTLNERKGELGIKQTSLTQREKKLKEDEEAWKIKGEPENKKPEELKKRRIDFDNEKKQYDGDLNINNQGFKDLIVDEDEYKQDKKAFEDRMGAYETEYSNYQTKEETFNKENSKYSSLQKEKKIVESKISFISKRDEELRCEYDALKKHGIYLVVFIIFLICLILIVSFKMLFNKKQKKEKNIPIDNICVSSNPEVTQTDYKTIKDLNSILDVTNQNCLRLSKEISYVIKKFNDLEEILRELQIKNKPISSVALSTTDVTIKPKENAVGFEKQEIIKPKEMQFSSCTIDSLYSSSVERTEYLEKKQSITYLSIDDEFYHNALNNPSAKYDAVLVEKGSNSTFVVTKDNLLYLNFYIYNEKKVFPNLQNDVIKVFEYIFCFEKDKYGRVVRCSPAKVKKREDGKYIVKDKGFVWMQNET